eukprot:NODE_302_length_11399_cov_0.339115.p6 type:complete len:228 gc:universal NODE_302_length_11399_cov_0.339115:874-1557(+)
MEPSVSNLPKDVHYLLFQHMQDTDLVNLAKTNKQLRSRLKEYSSILERLKRENLVFLLSRQQRPLLKDLMPTIVPGNISLIMDGNVNAILLISAAQQKLQRNIISNSVHRKLKSRPDTISESILPKICLTVDPGLAKIAYRMNLTLKKNKTKTHLSKHLVHKPRRETLKLLKDRSLEHLIAQKLIKTIIDFSNINRFEKVMPRLGNYEQTVICPGIKPRLYFFESRI